MGTALTNFARCDLCTEYLWGVKGIQSYRIIFIIIIVSSAFMKLELICLIADIVNGLKAFPNLVGLLGLSGVVIKETKDYLNELKA